MIKLNNRARRVAALGVATTLLAGGGAVASVSSSAPNPVPSGPSKSIVLPGNPGSDFVFHAVAPCRILDTRFGGGALNNSIRTFNARLSLAAQGGNAAGCGIPTNAEAVQVNLGAIPVAANGYVKGWETGQAQPLASLVNFGNFAIANMVTVPVNGSERFDLRVVGRAHVFADVAGYYTKPANVAVTPTGGIWNGIASGVTSVTRTSTGRYSITFDRNVTKCAATASSLTWATNNDVSPDNNPAYGGNQVRVGISDAANNPANEYFYLSLNC